MLQGMPKAAKILEKKQLNEQVYEYVVDISLGALPGQFVNMWIPGVDEKPFSVAYDDGHQMTFAIAVIGPFSKHLAENVKIGDKVGIRGPYGTVNRIPSNCNVATVAGGYGAAPLYFFAEACVKNGCKVDFIVGARNAGFLLYLDRASALDGVTVHIATDDGSEGHKGYCTQILEKLADEKEIKFIATCGPELMMQAVMKIAEPRGIDCDISVERYMKCGIGVCGNCSVDGTGEPSCINGPVMSLEHVKKLTDFGEYHRDSVGNKVYWRRAAK
ncbi:MAG: dihydroorotate dehydrogenase electron transfer subunit [Candidatus Peregrinibacteria bacterium]|nr:dihydroorotate dehydrogenase electron transfer subunit [Candidatus Peregrinibacteria bacterium]MDZ4245309.1 dihydroorotate dehydrogenase electron transfer subunit [Candidatus Gracilibacteria bacterium]